MGMGQSKAVAGFNTWAATYDQSVAEEVEKYSGMPYEEVLRRVVEAAGAAPHAQVLDVGTGTGALAFALATTLSEGHVVGIDPTPEMLRRAQENAQRLNTNSQVEFRLGAAESLPFPDNSFDIVVSSLAMHHTRVPQSLKEMARVLKPGGRLAIADMAHNPRLETTLGFLVKPLLALFYLASKRSIRMMRAEIEAYDQMYTGQQWEVMLRQAGLNDIKVQEFPHPTSKWYSSILIAQAGK